VRLDVSDVPATGRHLDLVADEPARAAIADLAGVAGLPRLVAGFDVTPHGRDGLHVVGRVTATVDQICVVTLDPIESLIDEPIDLVFVPAATSSEESDEVVELEMPAEGPEELVDGAIDLGAIAIEFLILGIDPYPRKADAVFEAPAPGDDPATHPFAALAALATPDPIRGSGQRGNSKEPAHSASEDARERAGDTRPEPGSSARAALTGQKKGQGGKQG
jgi:hypothetical protein